MIEIKVINYDLKNVWQIFTADSNLRNCKSATKGIHRKRRDKGQPKEIRVQGSREFHNNVTTAESSIAQLMEIKTN